MKPILSRRLVVLFCLFALHIAASAQPTASSSVTWHVYFSPGGEITATICHTPNSAKSTVLVQAYSFTSASIAEALVRAHKRGVRVQVLLDKSQRTQKYSIVDILVSAGIPTLIDAAHAIAHNKVMIIDNVVVITGPFNFTKAAAERNAENLLINHSGELAARYTDNWKRHEAPLKSTILELLASISWHHCEIDRIPRIDARRFLHRLQSSTQLQGTENEAESFQIRPRE